jgi:hypothetical protein
MKALAVNCTLKRSPAESSCELLLTELLTQLREHGVEGEIVRAVDPTPEGTAAATHTLACNAAHLARLLKADAYPSD